MRNFLIKTIRLTALVSFPTALFTVTLTQTPAIARSIGSCVNDLIDSGVARESAAAGCSDVLEPTELSSCVIDIQDATNIKAQDALQACYRVRRPEDLASCTIDISSNLGQAKPITALENCRRSLLPAHYAECTLALQEAAELSSMKAMETCITAEFFPSTIAPQAPAQ